MNSVSRPVNWYPSGRAPDVPFGSGPSAAVADTRDRRYVRPPLNICERSSASFGRARSRQLTDRVRHLSSGLPRLLQEQSLALDSWRHKQAGPGARASTGSRFLCAERPTTTAEAMTGRPARMSADATGQLQRAAA